MLPSRLIESASSKHKFHPYYWTHVEFPTLAKSNNRIERRNRRKYTTWHRFLILIHNWWDKLFSQRHVCVCVCVPGYLCGMPLSVSSIVRTRFAVLFVSEHAPHVEIESRNSCLLLCELEHCLLRVSTNRVSKSGSSLGTSQAMLVGSSRRFGAIIQTAPCCFVGELNFWSLTSIRVKTTMPSEELQYARIEQTECLRALFLQTFPILIPKWAS